MAGEGGFDLRKQRLLMTSSLYLVLAIVVYVFAWDIVLLITLGLASWYAYDFVQDYTKELVEPVGKYVLITGCDSGNNALAHHKDHATFFIFVVFPSGLIRVIFEETVSTPYVCI